MVKFGNLEPRPLQLCEGTSRLRKCPNALIFLGLPTDFTDVGINVPEELLSALETAKLEQYWHLGE